MFAIIEQACHIRYHLALARALDALQSGTIHDHSGQGANETSEDETRCAQRPRICSASQSCRIRHPSALAILNDGLGDLLRHVALFREEGIKSGLTLAWSRRTSVWRFAHVRAETRRRYVSISSRLRSVSFPTS